MNLSDFFIRLKKRAGCWKPSLNGRRYLGQAPGHFPRHPAQDRLRTKKFHEYYERGPVSEKGVFSTVYNLSTMVFFRQEVEIYIKQQLDWKAGLYFVLPKIAADIARFNHNLVLDTQSTSLTKLQLVIDTDLTCKAEVHKPQHPAEPSFPPNPSKNIL